MAKLGVVLCMIVLLATVEHRVEATVVRLLTDFIQNNVAGIPLIHKTEEYDFDPEISKKRRELYYEWLKILRKAPNEIACTICNLDLYWTGVNLVRFNCRKFIVQLLTFMDIEVKK